jgi:DNA-binding GntR family transcriptional regulator
MSPASNKKSSAQARKSNTKPKVRRKKKARPSGQTVSEDVYQTLKKDILTCRHSPGAVLRENQLAAEYGSSRVPVREACSRLQQEGLLEVVPYKGYFVSQVSLKDIADYFDLRLLLETHALGQAFRRSPDADLSTLEDLASHEYKYRDRATYFEFLEHNRQFHVALADLSGNAKLARIISQVLEQMQRFFFLGLDLGDFGPEMREEHELLTRALLAGNRDHAVDYLGKQIERSKERILKALVTQRADITIG